MKKKNRPKSNKTFVLVMVLIMLGVTGYLIKPHLDSAVREGPEVVSQNTGPDSAAGNHAANNDAGDVIVETDLNAAVDSQSPDGVKTGDKSSNSTVSTGDLSNTRHGWGLKRNNSNQKPEMPSSINSTLDKYEAYWVGKTNEKVVYLTFDEGYENGYTARILDALKANDVKAAFFVTGHYLKTQPELVKRMVAEGHIVGNHTDTHPSLPDVSDEQIKEELQVVERKFEEITGKKGMKYLRPPKGEYSERTLAVTKELGYHNIFWSLALVDWVPMPGGPQEAHQSVMDNLHNGALILLHAVSKDNTEAMDKILKDIKAQGYTFKSLDDLVKG